MYKIGVISDTHGFLDPKLFNFFKDCDEIWHAGDIGKLSVSDALENFKPLKAVCGNIDGNDFRVRYPMEQRMLVHGLDIWMVHIGGYPGNYYRSVKDRIIKNPPGLFISGHSHILKVGYDKKLQLLHINHGAAGRHGLHQQRTAVRFGIENSKVVNLEIIELGARSSY